LIRNTPFGLQISYNSAAGIVVYRCDPWLDIAGSSGTEVGCPIAGSAEQNVEFGAHLSITEHDDQISGGNSVGDDECGAVALQLLEGCRSHPQTRCRHRKRGRTFNFRVRVNESGMSVLLLSLALALHLATQLAGGSIRPVSQLVS